MSKRFSESEAQRIFARAAERQHAAADEEAGLTVEELEEIGRTAGLDPAFVRAAAADALRPDPVAEDAHDALGMPRHVRRERLIPGTVDDEAWARIVADLRARFKTSGVASQIGPLREWTTSASDNAQPAQISLHTEGEATRVVAEQSFRNSRLGFGIGGGVNLAMGLIFSVVALTAEPDMWIPAVVLASFSLVFLLGAVLGMRSHARRQAERFEGAMDRIELALREATPEPVAQAAAPEAAASADARIVPALLDGDAPDAAPRPTRRGRTRS